MIISNNTNFLKNKIQYPFLRKTPQNRKLPQVDKGHLPKNLQLTLYLVVKD